MEKENKKNTLPAINEEAMMNLMVDGVKKEKLEIPSQLLQQVEKDEQKENDDRNIKAVKGKSKNKTVAEINYDIVFFKRPETNARDGKTVYIRADFHEKLSRIVQVIGEDKLSIYAYLDNVLEYHFQEFGEQIIKSFNNKYKPIL